MVPKYNCLSKYFAIRLFIREGPDDAVYLDFLERAMVCLFGLDMMYEGVRCYYFVYLSGY